MEDSGSVDESQRTSIELSLIQQEIGGAIASIIGYLVLIFSSYQDRLVVLQRQSGIQTPNVEPEPTKLAAAGNWITLAGAAVLAQAANARFEERKKNLQTGVETGSIVPNVNIVRGFAFYVIGSALVALGTQQRVNEPQARVTIL